MVLILSTTGNIATRSTTRSPLSFSGTRHIAKCDFMRIQVTLEPTLQVDCDARQSGAACVSVHNLDPDLVAFIGECQRTDLSLTPVLRVSVIAPDRGGCDELPDVLGRYQVMETGIRFIPRFPFEPGVRYRARFDPGHLGRAGHTEVLALEFSLPKPPGGEPACVTGIFPSADMLPENLLRFYVRFSDPMRRGSAETQIRLLGPDGRPAPDVLYRPPLELWDRSMRHLTVLLDPGRLKRWVGPNRELGPPLEAGQRYVLAIGSEMVDSCGRSLRQPCYKPFVVGAAVRDPIAVSNWKVLPPVTKSRQPLTLLFPRPLDWALLWRSITVTQEGGAPMPGRISIDRSERRWRFMPALPWAAGRYCIRVAPDLEDVCGNNMLAAFDRPLRLGRDLTAGIADRSIPFDLADAMKPRLHHDPQPGMDKHVSLTEES
jgi:hypothetical protein